jgi:glyoxylate utilization-related uncharacterized protein
VDVIEPVVSVPVVRLENVLETALKIVVKNEVEVAFVRVVPPFESTNIAVVVAPAVGTATTWKRFRLESEDVAETVRTP